jgi:hypothetical protein
VCSWAIDLKFGTMLESTKEKIFMFWIRENSLHYGPKSKIYEKIKNRFFENVPDFIFGIYSVIPYLPKYKVNLLKTCIKLTQKFLFFTIL